MRTDPRHSARSNVRRRAAGRAGAVVSVTALGVALWAGPAAAHIEIEEAEVPAGGEATLTFTVGHGCDGSPTTRIRIAMPDSVPDPLPVVNPNWDIEVVREQLAEPVPGEHGGELTERVAEVAYTARTPLPPDLRDDLEVAISVPDEPGTTLAFPVVQECVEGSTAWTQLAQDGQDPEELKDPAPTVSIVDASSDASASSSDADDTEATVLSTIPGSSNVSDDPGSDADDASGNGLAIAGLVAGVGGMLLGGAALVVARKSSG